ncbi:hypothetical protein ACFX1X_045967 [Malus domestica]
MKHKSDVFSIFTTFKALVENYFHTKIITFYSDGGGEYVKLKHFLSTNGITHLTTPPQTPEHNGVTERRHRHVVETGLTLLHQASLPLTYWSYAFKTAVYLINRMPTHVLNNISPYKALFGDLPNYIKLRVFGCLCFPWLRPYNSNKLLPRSRPCLFLGYFSTQSAYLCLNLPSRRMFVSHHVRFDENTFPFSSRDSVIPSVPSPDSTAWSAVTPAVISIPAHIADVPPVPSHTSSQHAATQTPSEVSELCLSPAPSPSATAHPPSPHHLIPTSIIPLPPPPPPNNFNHHPMTTRAKNNIFKPKQLCTATKHPLPSPIEPTCVSQAIKDPLWRASMSDEFNALIRNGTWELVPPQPSQNLIGCKWVFRIKRHSDGSIDRYKARLVAKGFHQRPGVDFLDTFSPVVKPITIRIVLHLALTHGWPLRQLDVNNAFLHGSLSEDVYMVQPPGFGESTVPTHVCKLRKALYGLKQAPRSWYKELSTFLLNQGFVNAISDTSLFIFRQDNDVIFLLVYVDDLVLTGNNTSLLSTFIQALANRFSVKDLGNLHYFLGVEVIPTTTGLFLSQHKYIHDLLAKAKMDGAKDVTTPMATSTLLILSDGSPLTDATTFRQLVGGLQYLSLTRPDISFTVNKLSQFMHRPTESHWQALKRLLRYLKGTIFHGILFRCSASSRLYAFSDADWAGDRDDRKSTTGYVIYLGGNLISWSSRKQRSVARSSTEAEYRAIASTTVELAWLQSLLHELGVSSMDKPTISCDNIGATFYSVNPVLHSRMKHIELDFQFVRDRVNRGLLQVSHVSTQDQLADVLTKALPRPRFQLLRSKIGVSDGTTVLRGRKRESSSQHIDCLSTSLS